LAEVRRDLAAWLSKWNSKYSRLCTWVEENIEETLTYYRLSLSHPFQPVLVGLHCQRQNQPQTACDA
jgi:transposase-like protein